MTLMRMRVTVALASGLISFFENLTTASPSWSNTFRILNAVWSFVLGVGFSFLALSLVLTPKSLQWMMNFHLSQTKPKGEDEEEKR